MKMGVQLILLFETRSYRAVGLRKQAENVLDCCLLEQNTVTIFVKIYLNRKFKAEKKSEF